MTLSILEYLDRAGFESICGLVSERGRRSSRKSDDGASTAGIRELLERQGRRWRRIRGPNRFGPGYRVYFGKDGDAVVILLGGGTKKRQDRDIATAHDRWADYKKRKTEEK